MITASIVTYNTNTNDLEKVLDCTINSKIELIYVIDNSPTDQLKATVGRVGSEKVKYIYGHGNIGFGAGHNIAIKKSIESNSKYHVIINPDVCFEGDVINHLKDFMDNNNDIGLVMPKILYPNGETQYLCKLLPTPLDLFGRRFIPFKGFMRKRDMRYEMLFADYSKLMEPLSLSGCFMFTRTNILSKVNGFDERYFMYCEDLDLCRKINSISRIVYYPKVFIYHEYAKGSYKSFTLLRYHITSVIKYFNKWGWFFDKERKLKNKLTIDKYLK